MSFYLIFLGIISVMTFALLNKAVSSLIDSIWPEFSVFFQKKSKLFAFYLIIVSIGTIFFLLYNHWDPKSLISNVASGDKKKDSVSSESLLSKPPQLKPDNFKYPPSKNQDTSIGSTNRSLPKMIDHDYDNSSQASSKSSQREIDNNFNNNIDPIMLKPGQSFILLDSNNKKLAKEFYTYDITPAAVGNLRILTIKCKQRCIVELVQELSK